MNRFGLRLFVAVGFSSVVAEALAQVPVFLPTASPPTSTPTAPAVSTPVPTSPTTVPPVATPTPVPTYTPPVVDPSPVYPPPVPNLSQTQPSVGAAPTSTPPQSLYRPSTPAGPGAPVNTAPGYSTSPQPSAGYGGSGSGYGGAGQNIWTVQPGATGGTTMPYGTYDRGNFNTDPQTPPAAKSRWLPTASIPVLPGYGPEGLDAACCPSTSSGGGFPWSGGCGLGSQSACNGCDPCADSCGCNRWYDNLAVFAGFDAFKSPVDLDGLNGNFGGRAGLSAALPLWAPWGLGVQGSGSAGWYDWKGTQYTGEDYRFQNFWTLGVFQRSCRTGLGWGIAYDWLYDDYWANLRFGQWRVGASLQINPCNEIGFWGSLPDNRDSTTATGVVERFSPLLQGNLYWRHVWSCAASTTFYGGIAESPSDATLGANSQVALNKYLALYANAHYVLPETGGTQGRQDEIWNVSVGLMIYPGSALRIAQSQFRPFFTPADNGNFGVWRE